MSSDEVVSPFTSKNPRSESQDYDPYYAETKKKKKKEMVRKSSIFEAHWTIVMHESQVALLLVRRVQERQTRLSC